MNMSEEKAPELPRQAPAPTSAYAKLKRRHQRFVDEYVLCGIGTASLRRIGYKGKRANKIACELLANPQVRAAVQERTAESIAEAGVNAVRTMRELAHIAYFDKRRLYGPDGELLPVSQWPEDVAAAVGSIEVEEIFEGRGEARAHTGRLRKVRVWPKTEALKLLMQYQRLLVEKHEVSGPDGVPLPAAQIVIRGEEVRGIVRELLDEV
jgi:phage terminase small subunit